MPRMVTAAAAEPFTFTNGSIHSPMMGGGRYSMHLGGKQSAPNRKEANGEEE
jgi:hypothetical protein